MIETEEGPLMIHMSLQLVFLGLMLMVWVILAIGLSGNLIFGMRPWITLLCIPQVYYP